MTCGVLRLQLGHTVGLPRSFSTSACSSSYYQTLSIPNNATKSQIKSSFYKLSKKYHPDLTSEPQAKERFQKISEAYAVLGDDRKRRVYDRSLAEKAGHSRHPSSASAFHTYYADSSWAYETRRRPGATHAWDSARRPGHSGPSTHPGPGPHHRSSAYGQSSKPGQHYEGVDPFNSPSVKKATGFAKRPPLSDADHIARISSTWRALQVIGIIMIVATFGGGYKASA